MFLDAEKIPTRLEVGTEMGNISPRKNKWEEAHAQPRLFSKYIVNFLFKPPNRYQNLSGYLNKIPSSPGVYSWA